MIAILGGDTNPPYLVHLAIFLATFSSKLPAT